MGIWNNTYNMTPEERKAFTESKFRLGIPQIRIIFSLCSILYGLFAVLDRLLIGEYLSVFLLIRFGIVIPMTLVFIAWTYHSSFIWMAKKLTFLLILTGGVGIAFMLVLYPDNFSYYGGLFLVIFTGYFLVKQDTALAVLSGVLTLLLYVLGYIVYHGFLSLEAILVVTFYTGANLIGAFGNYQLEQIGRSHFMQKRKIEHQNELLEERVREQRTELIQIDKAINSTRDAVIIYNPQGEITYRNNAYEELIQWSSLDSASRLDPFKDIQVQVLQGKSWEGERILNAPDNKSLVLFVQADGVRDEIAQIIGVVMIFRDITDRKKNENELLYLSVHDHLTGLYNRRFFEQEFMILDTTENLPLSIIMCDVNGLKLVNDSFGHDSGDRLLKMAAETIKKVSQGKGIVARLGGDEFVLLLPNTSAQESIEIANNINELASKEKVANIELSISYGYDTKTTDKQSIIEVIANAENNMYRHKLYERSSIRSKTTDLIMSALFEKSNREAAHSNRVSSICQAIASAMNLGKDAVNQMKIAGLIHDIGKIGVDESILNKPGSLTIDERNDIERHPEIGWRLLSSTNEFSELAKFVLCHQEKWDGSGYPNGLKGEAIPLEARIIAVADAYDAMTIERSYRKALSNEEAIKELTRCSGTQFDPDIVDVFVNQVLSKNNDFEGNNHNSLL